MQAESPSPKPPAGLSARSRKLWTEVLAGFDLAPAEVELLAEACRALDRADEARKIIGRDGMTTVDRYGGVRQHPMLDTEARARSFYAAAVRQLGVVEAVEKGGR